MALAREPGGMRDLGDHPVAVAQQLDSALDPPFQDKLVWRLADRDLECLDKMVGAQPGNSGEFGEPEIVLQVHVNVIKDTPHLSRSEPRSEERRVGKECRCRGSPDEYKEKRNERRET